MTRSRRGYRASPIKRSRRTRADMVTIRAAIVDTLTAQHPATVRQIFYRLVSAGAIEKTEAEYKTTVCRLLVEMREDGSIPYGWLADSTRWMRRPLTHRSLADAVRWTAYTYRRALWADLPVYCEVWLEKDALAGVLTDITSEWDVPLMVTRGYPSLTFLYESALQMAAVDKPTFVYYFGDHDPSGVDIPRQVERRLRQYAPDVDLTFEHVAVTPEQIEQWELATRPTKTTDTRARSFAGESVEVDAIPPTQLRELARACIAQHIDPWQVRVLETAEESERAILNAFARQIEGAA